MEIQALRLVVTEQDLNELVANFLPDNQPLEKLTIRLGPDGVCITGEYPLFVRVSFETLWEPATQAGKVIARLVSLKAMGLPATVFKGTVLKAIAEAVEKADWLEFDGDAVVVDVDRMLAGEGIPVKTNLSAVRSEAGRLVLEGGAPGCQKQDKPKIHFS